MVNHQKHFFSSCSPQESLEHCIAFKSLSGALTDVPSAIRVSLRGQWRSHNNCLNCFLFCFLALYFRSISLHSSCSSSLARGEVWVRDCNFQAGQAAPRAAVAGAGSAETLTVPLSQRKGQCEKGGGAS